MLVYEHYLDLQEDNALRKFASVNDVFYTYMVRVLKGEKDKRLSKDVENTIGLHSSWYIQFPNFTYIRIKGFEGKPFMLPRYPSNKLIVLEFSRQNLNAFRMYKKRYGRGNLKLPWAAGRYFFYNEEVVEY